MAQPSPALEEPATALAPSVPARVARALNAGITWVLTFFVAVPLFTLLMRALNHTRVSGRHHLHNAPLPLVFVSNHVSILDDAFVDPLVFLPRALWQYKFLPHHLPEERNFFKGPLMSWFMRRMKCIPIRRGEGVFQPAVQQVVEALEAGNAVHIYPEGTRTRTGQLMPGKAGVGRALYETGATVVPAYHRGMEQILPIGSHFPRIGKRVEILIGEPFRIDQFRSLPNNRETWQAIADYVMSKIAALRDHIPPAREAGVKQRGPIVS